jgi:hypothetical protein
VAVFRRDVGKTHACRRVRDSDEVLARRALNLAAGKLSLAPQRLITMGTVEFELVCIHSLYLYKRDGREESMSEDGATEILFTHDGRQILIARDIASGREVARFKYPEQILTVRFAADEGTLVITTSLPCVDDCRISRRGSRSAENPTVVGTVSNAESRG